MSRGTIWSNQARERPGCWARTCWSMCRHRAGSRKVGSAERRWVGSRAGSCDVCIVSPFKSNNTGFQPMFGQQAGREPGHFRPSIGLHKLLVAKASKQRRRPRGKCAIKQFNFSPTNEVERHERQVFYSVSKQLKHFECRSAKKFFTRDSAKFFHHDFFLRFACKFRVQSFSTFLFDYTGSSTRDFFGFEAE